MLLVKDFRVPIAENPSPPPPIGFPRACPVKIGMRSVSGGDEDFRICASAATAVSVAAAVGVGAVGDLAARGFSHESEHDLAVMVSDFLENGSSGAESWYSSDSESGFSDLHHLAERVLEKGTGRQLGTDTWHKGLWYLDMGGLDTALTALVDEAQPEEPQRIVEAELLLQHQRMRHSSFSLLSRMYPSVYQKANKQKLVCDACELGKHTRSSYILKRSVEQSESDLLSVAQALIPSIKETDLQVVNNGQCNSSCIRQSLAKLLRISGYDAAVCSSKWQGVGKIPGGDHEYIDVVVAGTNGVSERLIIDIDFQSHFEIARAVESYETVLFSLPAVYVGSLERLRQLLQIMVEATRFSLKQNSMPLPPWRSLSYLQAKWHSPYVRKTNPDELIPYCGSDSFFDHDQCIGHLRRLKGSLWSDIDPERHFKHQITNEKKRRLKFDRIQRLSLLRC